MRPGFICLPLLLTLLAGCTTVSDQFTSFMGGEDNAEPPTPLEKIVQAVEIKKLWGKNAGDGSDEQYLKLIPAHAGDKIFVASRDGDIQAINALSGQGVWDQDADTQITGGPGAGSTLVTVGTGEAEVIALSAADGQIIWKRKVSSEVLAAPRLTENIVIVRTIDGKIFGLKAGDGEQLWVYDRTVPALTLRGTSAPVISGDLVIAGFDEGRLAAIELQTGKPVWETRVALGSGRSELERMVDIDAEPIVMDDVIYVATFQGRIAALALETGRILWTRDIPSHAGFCADDRAIYITDDDSAVWALDRSTGASLWKQEKLLARAVTAPDSVNHLIVVGDVEGYLHWLDKNTGEIVAREQVSDSKIIAAPLAAEGVVYAYASDGTLGAYTYDQAYAGLAAKASPVEQEPVLETDSVPEPEEITPPADMTEAGESQTVNVDTGPEASEVAAQEETVEENGEEEEKGFFGRLLDRVIPGD